MKEIFSKQYFENRFLNDEKRVKSFQQEIQFVNKFKTSGKILDIGCATGEMLLSFNWQGEMYGMEISDYAKSIAEANGISFKKDIFNCTNYFDVIVFRGTIQHIDTPFYYIKKCFNALKDDGILVFLATPNTNSVYFKLWNTLPFLDIPTTNYLIPNDKWFINSLHNLGFKKVEIDYPYLSSPYCNFLKDHVMFLLKFLGFKNFKFAFWKNSMNIIFKKG